MSSVRDDPFVIPASGLPPPGPETASTAPPPPEDDVPEGAAARRAVRLAARPPSRLGGWALRLALALAGLALGVWTWDFVAGLLARNPALGGLALVLAGLLALVLLLAAAREGLAIRRLARIDAFHDEARAALAAAPDAGPTTALVDRLERFYAARPDLRWERERLAEQRRDLLDADALLDLAERTLMAPLDALARREIEGASRIVAAATALIPLALIDVAAALSVNVRMIRRLAQIYGGRAGVVGSIRLLRMVATHLVATGAVAVGDDFIHSVAGGGLAARLSRRFGEGVVNGALTARIGIAAMEVCRPLPFRALPRPRVSGIMSRSVTRLMQKAD